MTQITDKSIEITDYKDYRTSKIRQILITDKIKLITGYK